MPHLRSSPARRSASKTPNRILPRWVGVCPSIKNAPSVSQGRPGQLSSFQRAVGTAIRRWVPWGRNTLFWNALNGEQELNNKRLDVACKSNRSEYSIHSRRSRLVSLAGSVWFHRGLHLRSAAKGPTAPSQSPPTRRRT